MDLLMPSLLLISSSVSIGLYDRNSMNKGYDETFVKVGYISTIILLISSILLILNKSGRSMPIPHELFVLILLGICASSAINLHNRLDVREQWKDVVYGQFVFSIFCLVMSLYYVIQYRCRILRWIIR